MTLVDRLREYPKIKNTLLFFMTGTIGITLGIFAGKEISKINPYEKIKQIMIPNSILYCDTNYNSNISKCTLINNQEDTREFIKIGFTTQIYEGKESKKLFELVNYNPKSQLTKKEFEEITQRLNGQGNNYIRPNCSFVEISQVTKYDKHTKLKLK